MQVKSRFTGLEQCTRVIKEQFSKEHIDDSSFAIMCLVKPAVMAYLEKIAMILETKDVLDAIKEEKFDFDISKDKIQALENLIIQIEKFNPDSQINQHIEINIKEIKMH